jgi:O-antigen/teichoic acid export membrane protein
LYTFLKKIFFNRTIKNFSVYGFGQAVNIVSPLLITPYLVAVCGLDKLGIIAIGQSIAYILIVVVDYSSYIIGVKDISINRNNKSELEKTYAIIFSSKLFLLFFVLFFVGIMIYFIPYFNKEKLAFIFSTSIIIGQFLNPTWFFQGIENFKWITIINILSKIIYVLGILFFIKKESDFIYANLWLGLGLIISNTIGLIWIANKFKFKFTAISFSDIKNYIVTDFSFCVSQLFLATRNYSSILIIGFIGGDYLAGQFKIVEQVINLFRTYLQMFFKFSLSYVFFEMDKSFKTGFRLWKKFNISNFIILLFLVSIAFIFSERILLFFKVNLNELHELNIYLQIALIIPLLIGITLPLEQLLFSLEKKKLYIKITIFITLLNILALLIAMNYFKLYGVLMTLISIEILLIIIYLKTLNLSSNSIVSKLK